LLKNTDFITEKEINCKYNKVNERYEIETPHITVLASPKYKQKRKQFNMAPIEKELGDFDFDYVYFDTLMFS